MPDCRVMLHCRLAAGTDPKPLGSFRGVVKAAGSDAERRRDARLATASGNRRAHFEAALTIARMPARIASGSSGPAATTAARSGSLRTPALTPAAHAVARKRRFEPASGRGLASQWEGVPDAAFMVLVLDERAMAGVFGVAIYREEFSEVV
jgi:hypothetical protein